MTATGDNAKSLAEQMWEAFDYPVDVSDEDVERCVDIANAYWTARCRALIVRAVEIANEQCREAMSEALWGPPAASKQLTPEAIADWLLQEKP
jgi:hypothetical protein